MKCLALAFIVLTATVAAHSNDFVELANDGWTALDRDDPAKAEAAFASALALRPLSPTIAYGLACANAKLEHPDEALRWLSFAVDWGYADADVALWERDFAALRERDDFAEQIERMRTVAKARARSTPVSIDLDTNVGSPDITGDRGLLITELGGTHLWDARTGELLDVAVDFFGVAGPRFSVDGRALVCRDDFGAVFARSVLTGRPCAVPDEPPAMPRHQVGEQFDPIVEPRLRLAAQKRIQSSLGHVPSIALAGEPLLAWGGADHGDLVGWDPETGEERIRVHTSQDRIRRVACDRAGKRLLIHGGASVEMFDIASRRTIWLTHSERTNRPESRHPSATSSDATISADDATVVVAWNTGCVTLHDAADGRLLRELEFGSAPIRGVRVTRDGRFGIISTENDGANVVELGSGRPLCTLNLDGLSIVDAEPIGDGSRWISLSDDGTVRLHDSKSGGTLSEIHIDDRVWWNGSIGARADSDVIVIDAGNSVELLRATSRTLERVPGFKRSAFSHAARSPDGLRLAVAAPVTRVEVFRLWTFDSPLLVLPHPETITCITYSPDGSRIATGCEDGHARIWDATSGKLLFDLVHSSGSIGVFSRWLVSQVKFTSDGKTLYTATGDLLQVHAWNAETGKGRWMHDFERGDGWQLDLELDQSGEHMLVQPMRTVLDTRDGSVVAENWDISGAGVAVPQLGTWLDHDATSWTETDPIHGRVLLRHSILANGDAFAELDSGYFDSTARTVRRAALVEPARAWPLDCFSSVLFDPHRVRAAASGVVVHALELPRPPDLIVDQPTGYVNTTDNGAIAIEAHASDLEAPPSFEVARDGALLQPNVVRAATQSIDGHTSTLSLRVTAPHDAMQSTIRLRAIGSHGLASRIVQLQVRF